jgi:c-di-GMP-binding flagellar brake protein YcgR
MAETEVQAQPEHTHPKLELEQNNDDYSKFLLYSRTEIVSILRSLVQKGAMLTVYFDQGKSFLLTTLLALSKDNNGFILDLGSDNEMNSKALLADKLIFTTQVDKVKIQFSLSKLSGTTYDGRPALYGAFPETLLRLQRREYFRLSTPIASPIKCIIPMKRADGSALVVEEQLLDISGGGVGLMVHYEQAGLYETEMVFSDCKIALPEEGLLVTTLRVRNAFDVTTKSGAHYVRVGCEFVDLQGPRLTQIQRYITRIERERKARLSGMA